MGGAEGVVDVKVCQLGESFGKSFVVGFFFGVETKILEQKSLAAFQLACHFFRLDANAISGKADILAASHGLIEQDAEPLRNGTETVLGIDLALGTSEVEARMRRAPWRRAYSMVGRVSRMRVSSVTRPCSSSGTLKSTRMKMR